MEMVKEAREKHHFTNTWGADAKSLYKDMNEKKLGFVMFNFLFNVVEGWVDVFIFADLYIIILAMHL